jgi:ABC-2 type transport system ATP-binding protein
VLVLGRGRLLAQGSVADLTRADRPVYVVRVKGDLAAFGRRLEGLGCAAEPRDGTLHVELPAGRTPELLWRAALDASEQVRTLKPLRNTLEEVFLKAVEEGDEG